jgi:hypothetical protein
VQRHQEKYPYVPPITYRRKHVHLSALHKVTYRLTVQIQAQLGNWLRASLLAKSTVPLMEGFWGVKTLRKGNGQQTTVR